MASATTTDQMFLIPAHPFWSLTIIAVDVVALWGLCTCGGRAGPPPSMPRPRRQRAAL